MFELHRLIWDDWNLQHIARHGVTQDDVEAVCYGAPILYRESYKNRLVLLGPVPNAPDGTYYPFTARPADRSERRAYQRLKGDPTS